MKKSQKFFQYDEIMRKMFHAKFDLPNNFAEIVQAYIFENIIWKFNFSRQWSKYLRFRQTMSRT